MHRSESEELASCAVCGAEISVQSDRSYVAGPRTILCYACAARRGGVYDEGRDQWIEGADLSGLGVDED